MKDIIYKIFRSSEWEKKGGKAIIQGSQDDIRDGFIHFSTAEQLKETIEKHFAGENELWILAVDAQQLAPKLKWEASRNNELFPHLYADLEADMIIEVHQLAKLKMGWDLAFLTEKKK